MLSISVNLSVVGRSSRPFIRHYHYLHADWWESVCVFLFVHGVVCAVFLHLSEGCPSLMATEAPLVPTVLIDVAQYCVGRPGLLFWTSGMLITTPFHRRKGEIAMLMSWGSDLHWWWAQQMLKWFTLQEFVWKCTMSLSKNNVFENRAV